MMKPCTFLFAAALVGLGGTGSVQAQQTNPVDTPPQKQEEPRKRKEYVPRLGLDLSNMRMISARTRSVFGNGGGFSYGPGFGAVSTSKRGSLAISPDFDIFNSSKKVGNQSNKIFILTAGAAFRYTIPIGPGEPPAGPDGAPGDGGDGPGGGPPGILALLSPYIEFGAGLTYADIKARSEGISGTRYTYTGSIALGTTIMNRAFLQARYRVTPKILTFNTSSFNLEFGIRF